MLQSTFLLQTSHSIIQTGRTTTAPTTTTGQKTLTGASDDVFSRFLREAEDHRIRFAETFETLDQFGQMLGVLGLDGDADDRRNAELHHAHVVGALARRDRTSLLGMGGGRRMARARM